MELPIPLSKNTLTSDQQALIDYAKAVRSMRAAQKKLNNIKKKGAEQTYWINATLNWQDAVDAATNKILPQEIPAKKIIGHLGTPLTKT